ncbi:MAG: 6-bladed beta-propeller [Tannerella sp.]|jgi:hypothetical protein|nr:6-bladed beta-propeller [Tannerella sp.]
MKFLYIIPLHLMLLLSCSSHESGTINEIKKIHFGKNDIRLSDSMKYRFVALETGDNCLIGHINRVEVFDNRIFVHDAYAAKSLFVFDAGGRFITQVGSKGDGPENYIVPHGFEIDRENRRIIVSDSDRKRLIFYDLDTYKYIMHKNCPVEYIGLFASKNRFYFFSHFGFDKSRDDNYILVTDTLFKPVFKDWKCNFKAYRFLTVSQESIYNINSRVFAYHHLQPYLYEITGSNCKIHARLSFEGFTFPALDFSADPASFQYMDKLDNSPREISAYGIYESNDLLFIQLIIGKQPCFAIHHKTTNTSSVFSGKDFIDSAGLGIAVFPVGATDEEIICRITASRRINREKIKDPAFAEIAANMQEDDNPVLCFFKWK